MDCGQRFCGMIPQHEEGIYCAKCNHYDRFGDMLFSLDAENSLYLQACTGDYLCSDYL